MFGFRECSDELTACFAFKHLNVYNFKYNFYSIFLIISLDFQEIDILVKNGICSGWRHHLPTEVLMLKATFRAYSISMILLK